MASSLKPVLAVIVLAIFIVSVLTAVGLLLFQMGLFG
jgi:hypothetical protein